MTNAFLAGGACAALLVLLAIAAGTWRSARVAQRHAHQVAELRAKVAALSEPAATPIDVAVWSHSAPSRMPLQPEPGPAESASAALPVPEPEPSEPSERALKEPQPEADTQGETQDEVETQGEAVHETVTQGYAPGDAPGRGIVQLVRYGAVVYCFKRGSLSTTAFRAYCEALDAVDASHNAMWWYRIEEGKVDQFVHALVKAGVPYVPWSPPSRLDCHHHRLLLALSMKTHRPALIELGQAVLPAKDDVLATKIGRNELAFLVGVDRRTIQRNLAALVELGYVRRGKGRLLYLFLAGDAPVEGVTSEAQGVTPNGIRVTSTSRSGRRPRRDPGDVHVTPLFSSLLPVSHPVSARATPLGADVGPQARPAPAASVSSPTPPASASSASDSPPLSASSAPPRLRSSPAPAAPSAEALVLSAPPACSTTAAGAGPSAAAPDPAAPPLSLVAAATEAGLTSGAAAGAAAGAGPSATAQDGLADPPHARGSLSGPALWSTLGKQLSERGPYAAALVSPLRCLDDGSGRLVLEAPDEPHQRHLQDVLGEQLCELAQQLAQQPVAVEWRTRAQRPKRPGEGVGGAAGAEVGYVAA